MPKKTAGVEFIVRHKEIGKTWVRSYSFAPIRNKNGEITGSVSVGRTISESKRAGSINEG